MKTRFFLLSLLLLLCSCNRNKVTVDSKGSLKKEDIKITLKLENTVSPHIIVERGEINSVPNGYGENDWKVYYKDSLITTFRHFKTNLRNYHDYRFEFYLEENEIKYTIDIKGDNDLTLKN